MKYVIGRCRATGLFYPIVFANEVVHSQAAAALPPTCELIGAGECVLHNTKRAVGAAGFSSSLQLGPSDLDAAILTFFVGAGISGLQLQNQITVLQLDGGKQSS